MSSLLQRVSRGARSTAGLVFSGVDSAWGFFKGLYRSISSWRQRESYFWGIFDSDLNPDPDPNTTFERTQSGMTTGARTLGVLGTVLCICGFLGALAIPLPGTGPLYALTVGGFFKAAGITMGWSALFRCAGSFFGGIVDYFKIKPHIERGTPAHQRQAVSKLRTRLIQNALAVGLTGEAAVHIRTPAPAKKAAASASYEKKSRLHKPVSHPLPSQLTTTRGSYTTPSTSSDNSPPSSAPSTSSSPTRRHSQ